MRNYVGLSVLMFLLAIGVSQLSLLSSGNSASLAILNVSEITTGTHVVTYTLSSGDFDNVFNLVYFQVSQSPPQQLPIYVYYGYGYSDFHSWRPYHMIVTGLYQDLTYQMKTRGLEDKVSLIDAQGLLQLINSDASGILVIAT